jgi:hypothetical protein
MDDKSFIKESLERFGLDTKFLKGLGLSLYKQNGFKSRFIFSIPPKDLDLIQVLSIYLKLKESNLAKLTKVLLREYSKKLLNEKDPLFEQAKLIHKDLREASIRNFIENENS